MTAPTPQKDGRMGVGSLEKELGSNKRERAYGFLEPGRNDNVNFNRLKKRVHLACLGLSLLAVLIYGLSIPKTGALLLPASDAAPPVPT